MSELTDQIVARLSFEAELAGPYIPMDAAKTPEGAHLPPPAPTIAVAIEESAPIAPAPASPQKVIVATPPPAVLETPAESLSNTAHTAPPASLYEAIGDLVSSHSPLREMSSLEELKRYVATTVLIPLDESRLNPVFGVGNPNANIMVIGEAPGADEDDQGEPFVGRAGQLLNKILSAIGFARSDVYIANILKSRPPKNRRPTPIEVEAHLPILLKQISLIRPWLILCVGKTAGTSLLDLNTSLAKMRGHFHDFHGIPVVVTFHPAALLRNPNWKRPTWEDVQMLRARYDEIMETAAQ